MRFAQAGDALCEFFGERRVQRVIPQFNFFTLYIRPVLDGLTPELGHSAYRFTRKTFLADMCDCSIFCDVLAKSQYYLFLSNWALVSPRLWGGAYLGRNPQQAAPGEGWPNYTERELNREALVARIPHKSPPTIEKDNDGNLPIVIHPYRSRKSQRYHQVYPAVLLVVATNDRQGFIGKLTSGVRLWGDRAGYMA